MNTKIEAEINKLRTAMAGLEPQRALLGEAVIEPALQSLREKIAALEAQKEEEGHPPSEAATPATEERRILTILFMDMVGSTSIAEKLDPEDYRELVTMIHDMAGKAVLLQHGSVLQYLGDGLLAAFGIQETSEQDSENAVRAGLEIQRGCATLQTSLPVQLRVGIHTGLVLIGELNLQARQEFTAMGEAMNLAARLQSTAPPGGVLISHDTYRYVRNLFDVIAQPPVELKGKSEPVKTYLVFRARPPTFRNVTRGVAGIETLMVGRQQELDQLHKLYQETFDQNVSHWVQLLGSPGIGKSRLVSEMMNFLETQSEKLWLLKARTFQGDERRAYALVRHFWFNRLKIAEDIPLEEAEKRWVDGFRELTLVGRPTPHKLNEEEAAHALGLLVGLPFANSPHLVGRRQDPAQVKGRAYMVSRALLQALREVRPVVILLEDLQWCDAASWDYLVETLLDTGSTNQRTQEGQPDLHGLFILGTARPEWRPPQSLQSQAAFTPIELTPLSQSACEDLVKSLFRQVEGVPENVAQALIDRSEGVPFFIEEMFNWLLDQGVIDQTSQPWHFQVERWQEDPLPSTLQHLLLARLSAASQPEKAALQRGAVFGRTFWERGIEAMEVEDSHALLVRAQKRGFVIPQPEPTFLGEIEWGFYHNLLQEATYESLLKRERRRLHQTAAEWLESQAQEAGRVDEFSSLLGEHYDLAGLATQAAHWYTIAGQRAKDRFALEEAHRLLTRALELIPTSAQVQQWQALYLRSAVLSMLGENETRQADLERMLAIAKTVGNEQWLAEAYHRKGHYLTHIGDYRSGNQAYENARLAAQHAGDWATEGLTLSLMAFNLMHLGEMSAAAKAAEQAINLLPLINDEISQAMILTNVAAFYGNNEDRIRAIEFLEQQIEITHRLSNLFGEAIGLLNLGYEFLALGMYTQCRERLEQSLQRSDAIAARGQSAFTRLNLALVYWRLENYPEAQQVLQIAAQELTAVGDLMGQAIAHTYQGLILESQLEPTLACSEFYTACQMLSEIGIPGYRNDAVAGLARSELSQGRLDKAQQYGQEAWEYLNRTYGKGMELPMLAYLTCFRIFNQLGDTETARLVLEKGNQILGENAARFGNPAWRHSYLENITEHREIHETWQNLQIKSN